MGQEKCLHTRDGNLAAGAARKECTAVTTRCDGHLQLWKTLRRGTKLQKTENCKQHRTADLFATVEETKTWHAAHSKQRRHAAQLCTVYSDGRAAVWPHPPTDI